MLDLSQSGFIDAEELKIALRDRGIVVRKEEIDQMIRDGDCRESDGLISFEEFQSIAKMGSALPSAELWRTVRQERRLDKGAKVVMRKYEDMKKKPSPMAEDDNTRDKPANAVEAASDADLPTLRVSDFLTFNENTPEALRNATIGMVLLTAAAVVRKVFFRL